ncbi:MAG: gamma-glutamyltransferase [Gammaproteobacteria bacterium]|nr:gamma-glutamyltransferase [Gammaproteobacteria bacterium]
MARLLAIAFLFVGFPSFADDTPPASAVASAHPLATEAGIEILKRGGNAFDAAVAVSAALAVVEPYSSGIGGGGFWLLHRASDGRQTMIDGREKAPAAAFRRMYLDRDDNVVPGASINGPLSAGIPGLVAGLAWLTDQYGQMPLKETLKPAIRYASEGFEVTQGYLDVAGFRAEALNKYPDTAKIFLKDGQPPPIGDRIVQKDLGRLLQNIADQGPGYFYRGKFAEDMVVGVRAAGGIWSVEDLANYRITERAPIIANYHDMRIVTSPPPSSGGVVLAQAFAILSQFDLMTMDHIQRMHVIIESMRRAYRDRAVYLGDPDFVRIRTDRLLDPDYLAGLAISIDPERATPSAELSDTPGYDPAGTQTTHFSVIDREGNRVAGTLSINLPFGACFAPPGTGVLLNDEMDDFAIKANTANAYGLVGDEANAIQPDKRPLSSMSPTFIETADRIGILGTPGGSRIISMVLIGILDFERGHLPDSWVSQRRFHHQYLPDEVQFEKYALTEYEKQRLEALGHKVTEARWRYGDMHAVMWDKAGRRVYAASDPRGEGKAEVLEE